MTEETTIDVAYQLNKKDLTEDTILVVKVDTGNMPPDAAMKYTASIKEKMVEFVAPASVLVVGNNIELSVIKKPAKSKRFRPVLKYKNGLNNE